MSSPTKGRKLPPLRNKEGAEDPSDVQPKPRRKKKLVSDGSTSVSTGEAAQPNVSKRGPSDRSSRTPHSLEDGLASEDSSSKAARRKKQRTRFDESHSSTQMADEENTTPGEEQTNPKKKRKKKTVGSSRETLMSEDTEGESPATAVKKKKKKKTESSSPAAEEVGLAAELADLNEDVVMTDEAEEEESGLPTIIPLSMHSQAINKVFVERKSGFKGTDVHKLARVEAERQIRALETANQVVVQKTTIQLGLSTHRIFKTIALFFQGILAGFALWQITMIWVISSNNNHFETLLEVYHPVALPVQSLYYLLLVISTVATLDRYDISHLTRRFVTRAFTLQNGAVSVLIYFLALIISLSIACMEDKIGLHNDYPMYPTLWADAQARDKELTTWRILSLVRGLAVIIAWLLISLRPNTDRLTKNLQRADENLLGLGEQTMEAIRSSGVA